MTSTIPPGHGEAVGPYAMPRCPECRSVIDTTFAAGTGDQGRCPTHGLVTAVYGSRPRPDFDPKVDYPERYTDGPI